MELSTFCGRLSVEPEYRIALPERRNAASVLLDGLWFCAERHVEKRSQCDVNKHYCNTSCPGVTFRRTVTKLICRKQKGY